VGIVVQTWLVSGTVLCGYSGADMASVKDCVNNQSG